MTANGGDRTGAAVVHTGRLLQSASRQSMSPSKSLSNLSVQLSLPPLFSIPLFVGVTVGVAGIGVSVGVRVGVRVAVVVGELVGVRVGV